MKPDITMERGTAEIEPTAVGKLRALSAGRGGEINAQPTPVACPHCRRAMRNWAKAWRVYVHPEAKRAFLEVAKAFRDGPCFCEDAPRNTTHREY